MSMVFRECGTPCSRGCFRPSEFGIVSWIASFIIKKYKKSKENYIRVFRLSSMGRGTGIGLVRYLKFWESNLKFRSFVEPPVRRLKA
jgi:hypothetical protein